MRRTVSQSVAPAIGNIGEPHGSRFEWRETEAHPADVDT